MAEPTDSRGALTERQIQGAIKSAQQHGRPVWLVSGAVRGEGRLILRATPKAAHFYFRYSPEKGKLDTLALGRYSEHFKLKDANERIAQLRVLLTEGKTRDIRRHQDEQEAAQRREREAREREAQSKAHTLAALVRAYADHLKAKGKTRSAKDVEYAVKAHIETAHPTIAAMPARSVTRREIATVVRTVAGAGKLRRAGILRSYLFAAYNLALRAESDPSAPSALIAYSVEANPVAGVATVSGGSKARNRVLTDDELRHFLKRLDAFEGIARDVVKLALLAGGQRPLQVARLRLSDVDTKDGFIRLLDAKGRRAEVREHYVPLAPKGRALVAELVDRAKDAKAELLFTSDGKTPVRIETIGLAVADIAEAMKKDEEADSLFQARDLRRTAETRLAGLGISRDLRAQLLSHGLSGIQAKHYDRHDYADEKRRALVAWEKHLADIAAGKTTGSGKVTSIKRKRA